ncbi:MAG TPA: polysaccharide biosynthesis tyrosine autokinase [Pyrinomonadaceae bacterium]|nr:polysaccharide biosynthesis tyrosine autokinase [Pyrinomonadaceae bacterium]
MRDLARRGINSGSQDDSQISQALVPYNSIVGESEAAENFDRTDLRRYWHAIRHHLGFIIALTILATVGFAIYQLRQPDEYEAKARIEVDRESATTPVDKNSVATSGASNDSVYFNTQLQILTSSALLRRVVKTLDLEHNEAFLRPSVNVNHSAWRELLYLVGLSEKRNQSSASSSDVLLTTPVASATSRDDLREAKNLEPFVGVLTNRLKVEPIKETRTDIKETRLIDISFNHNDPQMAARVVNAIADAAVYMNLERKSEAGTIAADFLQKRIAELQSQIREGEAELLAYSASNQIISLDQSQNTVVERLSGLNRELLEAENERNQAEAAYKAALQPNAAEALTRDSGKQTLETKLNELRQRRAQLLVENTEEWPEVKQIEKEIQEVESQMKEQRSTAAADLRKNLETRFRQAAAREESLREAFSKQQQVTLGQNQAAINYKIKQQEIDTSKSILQALLEHAKENDIAQAGLSNSIHVIDYATVPGAPVGPRRVRNIGLGFLFFLALAIGCVLGREILDNTFRSIADVENQLRMPALALVPSARRTLGQGRLSVMPALALSGNGHREHPPELLLNVANLGMAEVYRQLRATLLLSRGGSALKTLLVTSSLPGEGKTTTAVNTAISLAESGAKVLLIDGDLRRPRLHRIFQVSNERGFSDVLSNGMAEADVLSVIQKPETAELSLLTSGPSAENPTKLLDHTKLQQLLVTLESHFTHIVIDTPPIVPFADSVILSAQVDGVLMVVQGGKTPREIVLRSIQLLDDVDASILGVVLNNSKLQSTDTYYQSYCKKYYEAAQEE